jgi:hypothetical protein
MLLSDNSDIVKNLGSRQRSTFMEPRENMKCVLPDSVIARCVEFVEVFENTSNARPAKNIFHDKKWKEAEEDLAKITERILGVM